MRKPAVYLPLRFPMNLRSIALKIGVLPYSTPCRFYFIVTVAITHKIADSYLAAIDSSILDSHANPFHKTLTGSCKTCPYAETCSHPAEWVSEDVNASFTTKHGKHYYGHKKFIRLSIPYQISSWGSLCQRQACMIIPFLSRS